jgi:hypothetical protein
LASVYAAKRKKKFDNLQKITQNTDEKQTAFPYFFQRKV